MKSRIREKAQSNIQSYKMSENYNEYLRMAQPTKEDLLTVSHFDNEVCYFIY